MFTSVKSYRTHERIGYSVASILPFIPRAVFDDATTRIMGEAFDAACRDVPDQGQPAVVYEAIAKRIIATARKGERDPAKLCAAGLAAIGVARS